MQQNNLKKLWLYKKKKNNPVKSKTAFQFQSKGTIFSPETSRTARAVAQVQVVILSAECLSQIGLLYSEILFCLFL